MTGPIEVSSTLLAQGDSAVDEALKLYWKYLSFPKYMFEVLVVWGLVFFPHLNQDERENLKFLCRSVI